MRRFLCLLIIAFTFSAATFGAPNKIPLGYSIETIEIPREITLGVGGLAFTGDGDLLICSREGQVWKYRDNRWQLFADGLHEPLGIYVDRKTSEIWVIQRPELTKLIDEDGDGRADIYKTVNAEWGLTDNYHEYAFGLVRDDGGNFYGTLNTTLSWPGWAGSERWDIGRVHDSKMGRATRYRGWSFQISSDGAFVPWSSGLRSPAGLGADLEGELFYTDNQGDWNGSSSLQHVKKGRFHGHPSSLMDHPDFQGQDLNAIPVERYDALRTRPAVFLPHGELASSPGEPRIDDTKGKFGPFGGQFFVGDQTRSNVLRTYLEKVGGEYQGVAFNFIDPLQSGCLREVFGPDGSLWVGQTGRGWRSVGERIFGLQRIVWDGRTIPMEIEKMNVTSSGFRLTFTKPVDPAAARQRSTYQIKHWHYFYRPEYGSPKVEETLVVLGGATISEDGKVVDLQLPLIAKKIYQITLVGLSGADGVPISNDTGWYTLNQLPP